MKRLLTLLLVICGISTCFAGTYDISYYDVGWTGSTTGTVVTSGTDEEGQPWAQLEADCAAAPEVSGLYHDSVSRSNSPTFLIRVTWNESTSGETVPTSVVVDYAFGMSASIDVQTDGQTSAYDAYAHCKVDAGMGFMADIDGEVYGTSPHGVEYSNGSDYTQSSSTPFTQTVSLIYNSSTFSASGTTTLSAATISVSGFADTPADSAHASVASGIGKATLYAWVY